MKSKSKDSAYQKENFNVKLLQKIIRFTAFGLITAALPCLALAAASLLVGGFSKQTPGGDFPEGWEPLTFKKIESHTTYELVKDGETTVVKATSKASASGMIRKKAIDVKAYPKVQWRWKVANVYRKGDVTRKEGDDYPARIYITFAYDPDKVGFFKKAKYKAAKALYGEYPPLNAISYIWASTAEKGTVAPNPFAEEVVMVAVESGDARLNQWITEERNVYEDYKTIFKQEPPEISGVAVMTDSDNTGESAVAWYGDIVFSP